MKNGRKWSLMLGLCAGVIGAYFATRAYRDAKSDCPPFRPRRVYGNWRALVEAFSALWHHPEDLRSLRENRRISRSLASKMMLSMTGVNGGNHGGSRAKYAMRQGLSESQVESLARGEVEHATVEEAPALFFSRQYSERRGETDRDLVQGLVDTYGARTAHDLMTYIRLVAFTEQAGNTVDAFVSRVLGQPSPDTTLLGELCTLGALVLGVMPLVPALIARAWTCPR